MANTQTFTGDGETTAFNFTFSFFGVNDIHVSINNVEVTDFTVTPNATPDDADIQYTGGTLTFTSAPASGTTIKIWRVVELTRHIDYQPTLQPQSYQLNQDLNQCMEILKEQSETLTNVISLANIPTVADLLSELSGIRDRLDEFLTADDLTDLNTTVDGHTTSINTLNGYDYVVESQLPTAENDYTWYRKYKSGWVEQGGSIPYNTGTSGTINLVVTMATNTYACVSNTENNGANNYFRVAVKTTTTMNWYKSSALMAGDWVVMGIAA
ncbi:MAG: hypothetical protein J5613_03390 [Alphaproteobacteria bacterium]|nr:hypothetical protein [Alphaproteobacteria bacterium]